MDHHNPSHDAPTSNHTMPDMQMIWNWDTRIKSIVFPFWQVHSDLDLALTLLLVFSIAVLYEGLGRVRGLVDEKMAKKRLQEAAAAQHQEHHEEMPLLEQGEASQVTPVYFWSEQLLRSVLHALHSFIGLLMMLIAMTYNGYLIIAVVFGYAVGYFISTPRQVLKSNSVCHAPCC